MAASQGSRSNGTCTEELLLHTQDTQTTWTFTSFKQKSDPKWEQPRFKCGYMFGSLLGSNSSNLSPAAQYTKLVPPLQDPPLELLSNPIFQLAHSTLNEYIAVDTPFNVDQFENLLYDYPN
jgi:hypothetical protein